MEIGYNRKKPLESYLGYRLKKHILNEFGATILTANTLLNDNTIARLKEHRITLTEYDLIPPKSGNDSYAQQIVEFNAASSIQHSSDLLVLEATSQIKDIFESVSHSDRIPLLDIKRSIVPAVEQVASNPDIFKLFEQLQAKNDYTYRHNIGVGAIATLIGNWLHLSQSELLDLTIAATLHDIGKTKLADKILNKPGKLTDQEYSIIKQHSVLGYELIKNTEGTTEQQALVALEHHEREDGSGYPYRIKGDQINFFSKIVAVADVFHAMTSDRPYHKAMPFYQVLKEIQQDIFGKLDPFIVSLFINRIMDTMVGCNVALNDGRICRVLFINPQDPLNPLVQINSSIMDLSKESTLFISKVVSE